MKIRGSLKKISVKLILADAILLAFFFVATYAYFAEVLKADGRYEVGVAGIKNSVYMMGTGATLEIEVDPMELEQNSTNTVVQSSVSDIEVSLLNGSGKSSLTCSYIISYIPDEVFRNSVTNLSNTKELVLNATRFGGNSYELDLNGVTTQSVVVTENITSTDSLTIHKWTFTLRHYKLEGINQNEQMGRTFGGRIEINAGMCA